MAGRLLVSCAPDQHEAAAEGSRLADALLEGEEKLLGILDGAEAFVIDAGELGAPSVAGWSGAHGAVIGGVTGGCVEGKAKAVVVAEQPVKGGALPIGGGEGRGAVRPFLLGEMLGVRDRVGAAVFLSRGLNRKRLLDRKTASLAADQSRL